ncbi:Hypothetical predicted protein [Olea europaea subsp. europaea]|uniref:Secreted protein n=1 Tax=Olea europaea subsp. europaea TaxID=158383 RepID=A0A8S0UZ56_OLEEU|nr:Hypothetical predicted protein [Olea europaea subsp. europaea]
MSIARAFAFPSSLPLVALFFQWLRIEVGPMAVAWVKIGMGTHETEILITWENIAVTILGLQKSCRERALV